MGYLNSISLAAEDYSLSCNITTHEKDGQQQLQIGFLAFERLSVLNEQLTEFFPKLNTYNFTLVPIGIGVITSIAVPYAKKYLEDEKHRISNPYLCSICELTVSAGEAGKAVCQKANVIINAACCVSYVAMIAFGQPIAGGVGLAGLVMISVKRAGYMPNWLDRSLEPVILIASAVGVWNMQGIYMPVKAMMLLGKFSEGLDLLKRFETTQRFLPEAILNPIPGAHEIIKSLSVKKANKLIDRNELLVNMSHLYNEQVSKIFPVDYKTEVDLQDVDKLFTAIEKRFIDLTKSKKEEVKTLYELLNKEPEWFSERPKNDLIQRVLIEGSKNDRVEFYELIGTEKADRIKAILKEKNALDTLAAVIDDEEALKQAAKEVVKNQLQSLVDGFVKLRSGIVEGKVEDDLPPNFELFRRIMKALIVSMKEEADDVFLTDFQLFCEGGQACSYGWTKHYSHMVNVKTEDLEWSIHHQLAKLRGVIVNESMLEITKTIDLEMVGGNLDAHVVDAAHCAVYPRFRTYDAEFFHQVNPREMDETLWLLAMDKTKNRDWGLLDTAFLAHELGHVHPVLLLYTFHFSKHFKELDKKLTVNRCVDQIYHAIKPSGPKAERSISWQGIEKWLDKTFQNREGLVEEVSVMGTKYPTLTKRGVKLLLLDYSIFEPMNVLSVDGPKNSLRSALK